MNETIVLALGGNALGKTPAEQLALVGRSAECVADIIESGDRVLVVHGNGPQVGAINLAFSEGSQTNAAVPYMPFAECSAMSQGYIGYHLQNAVQAEFARRKINRSACTIVTQMVVSEKDPAFLNPTKPIGGFYSEDEARKISADTGFVMKEDAGRGYRRVIASPQPLDIVEKDAIISLLASEICTIACGGGGIPVLCRGGKLEGVDAVIDKDLAAELLAETVGADRFIILTAVDKVMINFGKKNQEPLDVINSKECLKYIEEGHFAEGSMLPKIRAALKFVNYAKDKEALICSLDRAKEGLRGLTGTRIKF